VSDLTPQEIEQVRRLLRQRAFRAPASASRPGYVTTGAQTIAGDKTLTGDITVTGDLTVTGELSAVNTVQRPNYIINGGFDIWQRGTPISNPTNYDYIADRWWTYGSSTVSSYTKLTTGLPTGMAAGVKVLQTGAGTTQPHICQTLETADVIPLQGQNVVFSFWRKNVVNHTSTWQVYITSGTGTDQQDPSTGKVVLVQESLPNVSSWTRYEVTFTIPDDATGLRVGVDSTSNNTVANAEFHFTGAMLHTGSQALPFSRSGGTIAGELAACQRYYWAMTATQLDIVACRYSAGTAVLWYQWPVQMRVAPTSVSFTPGTYYENHSSDGSVTITPRNASKEGVSLAIGNIGIGAAGNAGVQYITAGYADAEL